MNEIEILGNLGADPEVKMTKTGKCIVRLSVASSRRFTGPDGQMREYTDWIPCVVWNELAQSAANYLKKGKRVFIKGRYNTRKYEANPGETRYITEIIVNHISLPLPINRENQQVPQQAQAGGWGQTQQAQPQTAPQKTQSQDNPFAGFGQAKPESYAPKYEEDIPF